MLDTLVRRTDSLSPYNMAVSCGCFLFDMQQLHHTLMIYISRSNKISIGVG